MITEHSLRAKDYTKMMGTRVKALTSCSRSRKEIQQYSQSVEWLVMNMTFRGGIGQRVFSIHVPWMRVIDRILWRICL